MWPNKLDLTKTECRGHLRQLELEAYSSVVSTFRAQGSLDTAKSCLLEQLRKVFHINNDRHKAEIRRVANDEKLKTIAELLSGKNFDLEWSKEGHRTYPLITRTPPSTALKSIADHASIEVTHENSQLPVPSETKRSKTLKDEVANAKNIITKDPTLPRQSHNVVGLSKKELKRSLDSSVSKKRANLVPQYKHVLPTPNQKIRQLYNSFHGKKQRKTPKKHSKVKGGKNAALQSPPLAGPSGKMMNARMMHSYPSYGEGEELHKHLTSTQMVPPPFNLGGYKAQQQQQQQPAYTPILPTCKKDVASNLKKMSSQYSQIEPQPHYIPNMSRMKEKPSKSAKNAMAPPMYPPPMGSPNSQILHNTLKGSKNSSQVPLQPKMDRTNNDEIPNPRIIFSTTSSSTKLNPNENLNTSNNNINNNSQNLRTPIKLDENIVVDSMVINDTSPTSSLQLLSAAALATPKMQIPAMPTPQSKPVQIKPVTSKSNIKILPPTTNPTTSSSNMSNTNVNITTSNAKKVFLQPADSSMNIKKTALLQSPQQQTAYQNPKIGSLSLKNVNMIPGKPKFQFVVNSASTSNKQQFIIAGKSGIGGQPYTVMSGDNAKQPKVIVQSVEKIVPLTDPSIITSTASSASSSSAVGSITSNTGSSGVADNDNIVVLKMNNENQYNIIESEIISPGAVVPRTTTISESSTSANEFSNSTIITEDTPIDILPAAAPLPMPQTNTAAPTVVTSQPQHIKVTQNNYPKVQLSNLNIKTTGGTTQHLKNFTPVQGQKLKLLTIGGVVQNFKTLSNYNFIPPGTGGALKSLTPIKIPNNQIKINKNIIAGVKTVTIVPQNATTSQTPPTPIIIKESVQIAPAQSQPQTSQTPPTADKSVAAPSTGQKKNPNSNNPTTDWEQELDDVNRTKITTRTVGGKTSVKSSHPPNSTGKSVKKQKVTAVQPTSQTSSGDSSNPQYATVLSLPTAAQTTTTVANSAGNQQSKEDTSETNNNVYDTSNLVLYDEAMNTNDNIIIESVENIIAGPESLQEEDTRILPEQMIIINPEEMIESDVKEDSAQKVNGQLEEESTVEEIYQELVKNIHMEEEYQDEHRVVEDTMVDLDENYVIVEDDGPFTVSNPLGDEFMASTNLVTNDIVGSDGDGSESTSSQKSQQQSQHLQIQLKQSAPKIQSIE